MRFDIARSLNGEKIVFIARDANGIVRLRAGSEAELIDMIKNYNPVPSSKPTKSDDGSVQEEESVKAEEPKNEPIELESILVADAEKPEEGAKEIAQRLVTNSDETSPEQNTRKDLLQNELQEKVSEKKKKSGGSSFWDKLK